MNFRQFFSVFFAFMVFLIFSLRLSAQTQTTGDIAGVVTDPTGAVVPNAKVTLKDESRGNRQDTTTNQTGAYRYYLLPPGPHTVTVTVTGFKVVNRSVEVTLGSVVTADIQLTIGSASEVVSVTEAAPLLQAENGDQATTLNDQQVQELPNPGNDITFTAELAPGVVANTSGGGLGNFSSFGLGANANLFTLNGMDDNDPFLNLNNSGATGARFSGTDGDALSMAGRSPGPYSPGAERPTR
jgi:hypothetical protein